MVLEKVKSLVGGGEDETYSYRCDACNGEFESTVANPNDTFCPDCGSDRVHSSL
ncbi:rubredoxin [Halobacteriales archaeon QS_1_68_20]|nr:MAG: rubredoxin [Halobacteriales archaeon QS_1_68_20]